MHESVYEKWQRPYSLLARPCRNVMMRCGGLPLTSFVRSGISMIGLFFPIILATVCLIRFARLRLIQRERENVHVPNGRLG